MMEEVGAFPHNLANCSPVIDGEPALLQHRQRPGRKPRQHPVAEGAVDHRDRHRERQAEVGRQLGRRSHPARPVVDARGRRHRRRAPGRARAGRRLGARLRGADRQEAVGVRHQPEGLGVAEDAQRSDQHAGDLRERRLHLERPGSRARRRRRPRLCDRRAPSAATSPQTGHDLALRQDPPLDLDRGDQGRPDLPRRLQRLPALPRSSRPASRTGRTTCSRRSGDRRC